MSRSSHVRVRPPCREEGAETLIEQMTRDLDPIIRYGGMYAIALAYRGTSNNAAVQKLLHFAVSDVADDVRRAAVTCLGFLLLDAPAQCPRLVSLLVRCAFGTLCFWAPSHSGRRFAFQLLDATAQCTCLVSLPV